MSAIWTPPLPIILTRPKWLDWLLPASNGQRVITSDGKFGISSTGKASVFDSGGACSDCCETCATPCGNCCFSKSSTIDLTMTVPDFSDPDCDKCHSNRTYSISGIPFSSKILSKTVWIKAYGQTELFVCSDGDDDFYMSVVVVEYRCSINKWLASVSLTAQPQTDNADYQPRNFMDGDCCGLDSDEPIWNVSGSGTGCGEEGNDIGHIIIDVVGNTCCKDLTSGNCIQGADTNCNGTCDEDEV